MSAAALDCTIESRRVHIPAESIGPFRTRLKAPGGADNGGTLGLSTAATQGAKEMQGVGLVA